MSEEGDYNIAFREWYEDNITNDADYDIQSALYRPLYAAFLAGVRHGIQRIGKVRDGDPESA